MRALSGVTLALTLLGRAAQAQDTIQVERMQEAALRSDPRANQRELLRAATDQRIAVIKSDRLPQLSINGFASYQSDVTTPNQAFPGVTFPDLPKEHWQTTLDVEQRDLRRRRRVAGGAIWRRPRHAESQAGVDVALYGLRSDVNSAFFSAFLLAKRAEEYDALVADLDARLAAVRARVDAGTALGRDAAEIEAEWVRAGVQRDEAQASRRASLAILTNLVGQRIDTTAVLVLPTDEPEMTAPDRSCGRGVAARASRVRAAPPVARAARARGGVHQHREPPQALRVRAGGRSGLPGYDGFRTDLGRVLAGRAPGEVAAVDLALRGPEGGRDPAAAGHRHDRGAGAGPEPGPRRGGRPGGDRPAQGGADRRREGRGPAHRGRAAGAGAVRRRHDHHGRLRGDAHRRARGATDPGSPSGRAGPGAGDLPHHPGAHAPNERATDHEPLVPPLDHARRPRCRRRRAGLLPEGRRGRLRKLRGDRGHRGRGGRRPAPGLRPRGGRPGGEGRVRRRGGHDPAPPRAAGAGGAPGRGRPPAPGRRAPTSRRSTCRARSPTASWPAPSG